MTASEHRLVSEYLARLERDLGALSPARRAELVGEIAAHIDASLAEHADPTDADVRAVLDRMGDSRDIAEEAGATPAPVAAPAPPPRALMERLTLVALPFAGVILPFLGWLVAVAMLWSSSLWTTRDKLVGTLVVPGGYSYLLLVFGLAAQEAIEACPPGGCTDDPFALGDLLIPLLLVAPLAGPIYLGFRLRTERRRRALSAAAGTAFA